METEIFCKIFCINCIRAIVLVKSGDVGLFILSSKRQTDISILETKQFCARVASNFCVLFSVDFVQFWL
jgi:hypothetical protein